MNVSVFPGKACGSVTAPPSKSYAHRMLICAALSKQNSVVHGIAPSEDMKATLDCLSALGIKYTWEDTTVNFQGAGDIPEMPFNCRESGSTIRFFIPIAMAFKEHAIFTGAERLMQRGIGVYEDLFKEMGIAVDLKADSITVDGQLKAGNWTIRGDISSQFVTGLLYALPLLKEDSTLTVLEPVESRPYIDITLDALSTFGIEIKEEPKNVFHIKGNQSYKALETTVEGDWSNAAFLYALKAMGNDLEISGLNPNSFQGDKYCVEAIKQLEGENPVIDLSDCPDLGPVLFAFAAAKNGALFTGTRRLLIKESDRANAMATELKKFGIDVDVEGNSVVVHKGTIHAPEGLLEGYNDHRIVMALSLLCTRVGGTITDSHAVRKSYPNYFEVLKSLGLEIRYESD